MEFGYTRRLQELKERAAGLAQKIAPYEEHCEFRGGLSADELAALRQEVISFGLQAVNMPREWGGAGLSVLEQVVVQEELGKLTNGLWELAWRPASPLAACTPAQRERWLIPCIRGERRDAVAITEPAAGSDPADITASARRDGDGFVLSGEKWFVTVGDHADFLLVLARVPDAGLTLFLVDKQLAGVEMKRNPRYMHNFVFGHPEFTFQNVRLGPEAVLGTAGRGYGLVREWFTAERMMVAARAVGAGERALTLATDWARQRKQRGRPIISFQLIQAMLADSAVDIAAARSLVYQAAWEIDSGGDPKTLHARAAMAKLMASEAAGRVADRAVQIFGGRGYMREQPAERIYRDVRLDRLWEGTSEIQRLIVANEIDKRGLAGLISYRVTAGARAGE